ncbi:MAG: hypothetical protein Q8L79_02950 [Methylobacter sp.]|uniref:hypothetical protein n=1 Tax=Methylobacter sp. TaxID=2051955 RepID=UPI002730994B|nr:hypothetical protein [Methylobacter sp.]MDP1664058.1 hypothetical protein [Methylobacter sp.]
MKKIIAITLFATSLNVIAADQSGTAYNPNSYGAPQLYYSAESIRERREQELMKESNDIAKERLEVERELLREEKREHQSYGGYN